MNTEGCKTQFIIDNDFLKENMSSFYDNFYVKNINVQIAWRNFAALEKSKSVLDLCKDLNIKKVLDVGCGLCNVISRLEEHNFADEYCGIEISPSAIQIIKEKIRIPNLKYVYLIDSFKTPFADNFFDLGILSHVLEHVKNPSLLLRETLRTCKYVVIEVPLEDALIPNLYDKLISRLTGRLREENPTGHIHFFNRLTASDLINKSGAIIIRKRIYREWRIFIIKPNFRTYLSYLKSALFFLIYKITGSRLMATNYAILIKK